VTLERHDAARAADRERSDLAGVRHADGAARAIEDEDHRGDEFVARGGVVDEVVRRAEHVTEVARGVRS